MQSNKIAILIKMASLSFDKISNPILSKYNLTAAQYRVLKFLYSRDSKSSRVVDIEKYCSITHPTALGLIDALEKKGFTIKIVNPNDARSKVISLTDKAIGLQSEVEDVGEKIEMLLTENLSDEEKKQLIALLQKLLKMENEGS